jgi:hypothetical protein
MQPSEVLPFLRQVPTIQSMAEKVVAALLVPVQTNASHHVSYSDGEKPISFNVTVLGIDLTARLEYFNFISREMRFLAGRFSFFHKIGNEERRLDTTVRMILPDSIYVSGGHHYDIDDLDVTTGIVVMMRDKLSRELLAEQMSKWESWSLE